MKSISTIFKSGFGPYSSHTVGPTIASEIIKERYPQADYFDVFLFGSLSLTGKGHGTDIAIESFLGNCKIIFDTKRIIQELPHPNTMIFKIYKDGQLFKEHTVLSVGGGEIRFVGEENNEKEICEEEHLSDILAICESENITLPQYIYSRKEEGFKEELAKKWELMKRSIENGLNT